MLGLVVIYLIIQNLSRKVCGPKYYWTFNILYKDIIYLVLGKRGDQKYCYEAGLKIIRSSCPYNIKLRKSYYMYYI